MRADNPSRGTLFAGLYLEKAVLFLCSLFLTYSTMAQPPAAKEIHLYILAGQSNMAGRGTVDAIDTLVNPHIFMFNKTEEWVPAKEPLAFDKPKVAGVGPGFAFANALFRADPSADIYLIPCAVGGTRIDLWQPGAFDNATQTHPYDDAIRRIRAAMKTGIPKGIIWHQGESDCNPALSNSYEQKLRALIARFRQDIGSPELPFIAGEVAHFSVLPDKDQETVNLAIKTVVATTAFCGYVQTQGLQHRGDSLHFDSPSAREIGKRYAAAMRAVKK